MSYDIALYTRVHGADNIYVKVAEPEFSSPTYNLRDMFVACMGWDYSMSEEKEDGSRETVYYPCRQVKEYVIHGISELSRHGSKYTRYEDPDGWGVKSDAYEVLVSLKDCINEMQEIVPIDCLYMAW